MADDTDGIIGGQGDQAKTKANSNRIKERNTLMRKKEILMTGIIAAGCALAMGPAWAQTQGGQQQQTEAGKKRQEIMEKMTSIQERAREVQQDLQKIDKKAREANPDIQKLEDKLMDTYRKKLDEYGYPSEKEMEKLQEMQKRLQGGDVDEAERQKLTQQFNEEVAKIQEARQKAQSDSQVIDAQKSLEKVRTKAMSKIDPKTEKLQSEMEDIQSKLEELRGELQKIMQGAR